MEELTREEAIRRHRLMWNWIADEIEKTGKFINKHDVFKHFGWNLYDAISSCWCCTYAKNLWLNLWLKDETNKEKYFCDFCPLDWSNGKKEIAKSTCTIITTCDGFIYSGLYGEWYVATVNQEVNPAEASRLARIIANLPEKKEVQNND